MEPEQDFQTSQPGLRSQGLDPHLGTCVPLNAQRFGPPFAPGPKVCMQPPGFAGSCGGVVWTLTRGTCFGDLAEL